MLKGIQTGPTDTVPKPVTLCATASSQFNPPTEPEHDVNIQQSVIT